MPDKLDVGPIGDSEKHCGGLVRTKRDHPKKDDAVGLRAIFAEGKRPEITIKRQQDAGFLDGPRKQLSVKSPTGDLTGSKYVVTLRAQQRDGRPGDVLVSQQSHLGGFLA